MNFLNSGVSIDGSLEAGPGMMKLGVGERHAVKAGMSGKAYWHLAKIEALNVVLSNAYLKEQGLTTMRTLWIKVHHPATAL
jgi:RNA-directed DNA polymerase